MNIPDRQINDLEERYLKFRDQDPLTGDESFFEKLPGRIAGSLPRRKNETKVLILRMGIVAATSAAMLLLILHWFRVPDPTEPGYPPIVAEAVIPEVDVTLIDLSIIQEVIAETCTEDAQVMALSPETRLTLKTDPGSSDTMVDAITVEEIIQYLSNTILTDF